MSDALQLFCGSIELGPDFASASGMVACCCGWRKINAWIIDPAVERREGRAGATLNWAAHWRTAAVGARPLTTIL
jgi:hypothetical protein